VALVVVVGAMAVVTLFLLSSLALVLSNATPSREDQDAKAAVAAAEAGVDEYLARLNANDSYWDLGNSDTSNPAFSGDRTIPGTGGQGASYTYQVLNTPSEIAHDGVIRLQVTGRSSPGTGHPVVSRTLTATLKPKGFLRYIYFSDYEVVDPSLFMSDPVYVTLNGSSYYSGHRYRYAVHPTQACVHYYEGRSSSPNSFTASAANPVRVWDRHTGTYTATLLTSGTARLSGSSCAEIQWTSGDVVEGPLHSNDALRVSGSVLFSDQMTESSWPACQATPSMNCWWGGGTPSASGYRPKYAAALSVPAANTTLLNYVEPGGDPATGMPGCLYTGATRIVFQGTTMRVLSPATTSAPARCLDVSNRGNEQVKSIPPVIYVDATASACSSVGYPASGEWTGGPTTDYACTRGTAFVQGEVDSQVTVASKDDIVVTGNITLADNGTGTDVVGLVAANSVWVYHPVDTSWWHNNLLSSGATVHYIEAAVLSLSHSFLVQNWPYGSPLSSPGNTASKLNVLGSISQKFRGPVGTGTGSTTYSGYLKNYMYDTRLAVMQPPYFLKPDSSPWVISTLSDK
jgi:hypothetical protein